MTPIISPWIFYLIDVCGKLQRYCSAFIGLLGFFGIVLLFCYCTEDDSEDENEPKQFVRAAVKPYMYVSVVTIIVSLLIPSEDTCMKMLAASLVTPDNIAAAQGNIIDFIGKVAEAITKAKG